MFSSALDKTIRSLVHEFDRIPIERKNILEELAVFIQDAVKQGKRAELTFICTHNSRRSHISQIWAQTAAAYYRIQGVFTYSGGTEVTAFNTRAVKGMEEAGFTIRKLTEDVNPRYEISYAENVSLNAYSKRYDASGNPISDFCAVMTCSHADEHCPYIEGAALRIALPYDDPKSFDDTPLESQKYNERINQIGREMLYTFSLINQPYRYSEQQIGE